MAMSTLGKNNTKTYLITDTGNDGSVQTVPINTPAQVPIAVTENLSHLRASVCIVENISPEYIEVLGSAWDIDPRFFFQHAENPTREHLWVARRFEPDTSKEKFSCINGNFEYHGLNVSDDTELNFLPNNFERHCFRSTWEGVETIISNTKISYYRVQDLFYLFLVDAPLDIQKRYDDTSRQLRPSLRLPYANNRGGLQLQSLLELRDKKGVYHSLSESLKSVFLHGSQRSLLFHYSFDLDVEGAAVHHAAFPASPLCYMLSNSISQTNLRYLSREIRRISFQEIRDPDSKTNDILHDRREDLVAFFNAGLAETIKYVPDNVDKFMKDFLDLLWPGENWTGTMTSAHKKILEEGLELEKFLMETFQLLLSSTSIQDAKLSNQQSSRATQLTILASIYVPLSFVTGIFGMNLKELNQSGQPIWAFFVTVVVAVIATVGIFLILKIRSKQTRTKNNAEKAKRSDEVDRETRGTSRRPGRVFANNRTIEKSLA